ncbi:hypothetical protein EG329_013852 [Mollisiaceae sp. DMI_Dod_QoI]|nr:hypothetical protein EG329_013852 [Helotiales sp. DMI_Dod_QoI]
MTELHHNAPPILTNPFSTAISDDHTTNDNTMERAQSSTEFTTSTTTTTTTTTTAGSVNRSASESPVSLRSDGRRNSFGQSLPSPTVEWKPTFNRVCSWNREDRKREMVLQREIAEHEGHGGGFSERREEEEKEEDKE